MGRKNDFVLVCSQTKGRHLFGKIYCPLVAD